MGLIAHRAACPTANGAQVSAALDWATRWLSQQAERVDALNVFPVPDGDTGTNMLLTLRSANEAAALLSVDADAGEVAAAAARGALLGGRGNSGVILSQMLRGFAETLAGKETIGPDELASALAAAGEAAYAAVSRPVEGTLLTVARAVGAAAREALPSSNVSDVLEAAVAAASAAVARTPEQLDVLRKAGVVDSGGEGYRVLLEGILLGFQGRLDAMAGSGIGAEAAPGSGEGAAGGRPGNVTYANLAALGDHAQSAFGFCTELLLWDCNLALADVRAEMETLGDSVLVVGDADALRIHLHAIRPGRAVDFAVDHGTLAQVKVENMALQHASLQVAAGRAAAAGPDPEPRPEGQSPAPRLPLVAVAAGAGLQAVFHDLGVAVVDGGETMNPSVRDLLAAVDAVGAREVILLPNDGNVLLGAGRAREASRGCVEVVPTTTVPQGIAAALAYNFELDLGANVAAMVAAAGLVRTIQVAWASRTAEVDGVAVAAGEALALLDGRAVAVAASPEAASLAALGHAGSPPDLVTIYAGAGTDSQATAALADQVRDACPGADVQVIAGGQPHYPYVISLE